jgi:hypothetical protein
LHGQGRHVLVCEALDRTEYRKVCLYASNSLDIKNFTNGYFDRVSTAKYAHPLCERMRSVEEFEPFLATAGARAVARSQERRRRKCTRCEIKPNEPWIHCIRPARIACDPSQDKRRFK